MRLLLDSDAFCKFAAAGLFEAAAEAVGVSMLECARLAALPHMLRRGALRRRLGDPIADAILPLAAAVPVAPAASAAWADRLVGVSEIDPGEAQLLAVAAEQHLLLMTGDKRSLAAVRGVEGFLAALRGKIVLPEVVFLRLCELKGDDVVRRAVTTAGRIDVMLDVAFSPGNCAPRDALQSYVDDARRTLSPLELWQPSPSRRPA